MTVYIDASAIVATVVKQRNSRLVDPLVRDPRQSMTVSDFAMAESSGALAALGRGERRPRHGVLAPPIRWSASAS